MLTNENLPNVQLQFWQPLPTGSQQQDYTIRLTNARIVKINSVMLDNKRPENQQLRSTEEVSFVYQKIEWTWMDGGITYQADLTGAVK